MSLGSGVASIECKSVETVFGFIWLNSVGRLSRSCVDFVPDVRVFGIFLFFLRGGDEQNALGLRGCHVLHIFSPLYVKFVPAMHAQV